MSTIRATYIQHGSSAVPNITLNASGDVVVASGITVTGSITASGFVSSSSVVIPSGSAAAPGIYFAGDTDTGLFTASGNTIAVTTSGTERLRVDDGGRLLVGTSSGSDNNALLKVQGNVGGATGVGWIDVRRGVAIPGADGMLGYISISDSSGNIYAAIEGYQDAAGGTNDYPGRLVFSTTADGASSPTERMRISQNGNIAMSSSISPLPVLGVDNTLNSSGTQTIVLGNRSNANNTSSYYIVCQEPGVANRMFVYGNGNVANTNNSYGAISDIKLKENIVDASSQWGDIKNLRVVNYNFKPETGNQTFKQLGLIAQEVELVSPGLVTESPDRDAEGNDLGTVTKSVNYSVLYMKAVKALQEAMERIEVLEAKVNALEGN